MLRVICTNVMGRAHVSVHCVNHGDNPGHVVWSGRGTVGAEHPARELTILADALLACDRSYGRGEFAFFDDC
jgi:hypothetical protein